MNAASAKPGGRVAVVSPFLDKRHGTERAVVECFSRLAGEYDVHLYCQHVEDMDMDAVEWRRIPKLPGPHLFNYLWWFAANHVWRRCDRFFRRLVPDLVFSPGVNCLDADVVSVHIVFAVYADQVRSELVLGRNPISSWPRLLHRRLYYRLIVWLEGKVYRRGDISIVAVSRKVASDVARIYGRGEPIPVVYHALDSEQFSPERRAGLRDKARAALGLSGSEFAVLLIGNDWKNKGLACLLEAVRQAQNANLRVLVVGRDDARAFASAITQGRLGGRVSFLAPRPDVEFYYAAADAYVGPSLEDAFSLPPAEAMACGLPVIASRTAGVAEIITHGKDGLVLEVPTDAATLAGMIRGLAASSELCRKLGEAGALTARGYTWERNAQQMREIFRLALAQKEDRNKLRRGEAS